MSIKKFLKKEKPEQKLLQAFVNADLYDKFSAKVKKDKFKKKDVIEAMMKAYLEEK